MRTIVQLEEREMPDKFRRALAFGVKFMDHLSKDVKHLTKCLIHELQLYIYLKPKHTSNDTTYRLSYNVYLKSGWKSANNCCSSSDNPSNFLALHSSVPLMRLLFPMYKKVRLRIDP